MCLNSIGLPPGGLSETDQPIRHTLLAFDQNTPQLCVLEQRARMAAKAARRHRCKTYLSQPIGADRLGGELPENVYAQHATALSCPRKTSRHFETSVAHVWPNTTLTAPPPARRLASSRLIAPHRLKAKSPMTGTLRAARVPYSSDSAEYDEAMDALDEHAGCYPIRGELRVRARVHAVGPQVALSALVQPKFTLDNSQTGAARTARKYV